MTTICTRKTELIVQRPQHNRNSKTLQGNIETTRTNDGEIFHKYVSDKSECSDGNETKEKKISLLYIPGVSGQA